MGQGWRLRDAQGDAVIAGEAVVALGPWSDLVFRPLGYNIPLSNTLSLDLSGTIGMVDPRNGSDYIYHGIGATIPYKLSDAATASISAQYAGTDISGMDDHVYFTVGMTFGL